MTASPRHILLLVGAVLSSLALFAPAARADAATTTGPTIRLSADRGLPGSTLLVSASGFSPGEHVNLYVGVRSLAAPVADRSGSVTGYRITVPAATPLGSVPVVANGSFSRYTAEATWTALSSPWGQPGGTAAHTQQNAAEDGLRTGTVSGLTRTNTIDGPLVRTEPTVVDDVAYVADLAGAIKAYRPDGSTVWVHSDAVVDSLVVAGAGRIYFLSNTVLRALDQKTGAVLWTSTATASSAQFSYADGVLYLSGQLAGGAGTAAVSATTGVTLWSVPVADASDTLAPAVADGRVLVRLAAGGVTALSSTNGARLWSRTLTDTAPEPVAVSGTTVIASGATGTTALNAADGSVRWTDTRPVDGQPAIVGSRVIGAMLGDDNLYRARALSLADGEELWQTTRVNGSASASAGVVFFAQFHDLSAIDPVDGDLLASARIDDHANGDFLSTDGLGTPTVSGGAVWVPVSTSDLFGRPQGDGLQRFAVPALDGVPAVRVLDDTAVGTAGAGDNTIVYTNGWVAASRAGAYQNTFHYARSTGARATVGFTGVGVRIWFSQASNFGTPSVYLGGLYVDSFNEEINPGKRDGVKSWSSPLLTRGHHTLVIAATSPTVINVDRIDLGTS